MTSSSDPKPAEREPPSLTAEGSNSASRRSFLTRASSWTMVGGLAASYGTLAAMAGRYLYPDENADASGWQFVATTANFPAQGALVFISPVGQRVVIARQGAGDAATDFIALSSVCPHLGCQVHWEPQHNRFFCPCHNGVFDPQGRPVSGPPAAANQSLARYPLEVDQGMLFIQVPLHLVGDATPPAEK